jgi:hypothetical protein
MPLDYAALKKQRFRWHSVACAPACMRAQSCPRAIIDRGTALGASWRGPQWLNDPMTVAFTIILLIAASALIGGGSLYLSRWSAPPLFHRSDPFRRDALSLGLSVRVGCTW